MLQIDSGIWSMKRNTKHFQTTKFTKIDILCIIYTMLHYVRCIYCNIKRIAINQSAFRRAIDWKAGVRLTAGAYMIFLFPTASRSSQGPTQPRIQWVPGALSPGIKRLGHEASWRGV
jgi:hypothetical protein